MGGSGSIRPVLLNRTALKVNLLRFTESSKVHPRGPTSSDDMQ